MTSYDLFTPVLGRQSQTEMVAFSLAVIGRFTEFFNARYLAGMDSCLHFPHVILSGDSLSIWHRPGQMPPSCFADLASTGWHRTVYLEQRPVLVSPRKVHLVVDYTRSRADGTVVSRHENLWIATEEGGRWGMKERAL